MGLPQTLAAQMNPHFLIAPFKPENMKAEKHEKRLGADRRPLPFLFSFLHVFLSKNRELYREQTKSHPGSGMRVYRSIEPFKPENMKAGNHEMCSGPCRQALPFLFSCLHVFLSKKGQSHQNALVDWNNLRSNASNL
jgi:hypothetical protein